MRPFVQTEKAKSKTALVIAPSSDSPMYSASIQQTAVREKLNFTLAALNSTGGVL